MLSSRVRQVKYGFSFFTCPANIMHQSGEHLGDVVSMLTSTTKSADTRSLFTQRDRTSHEFVQLGIESKEAVSGGHGLCAEHTIDDVKAMLRAHLQRPDKLLLIVISDPL